MRGSRRSTAAWFLAIAGVAFLLRLIHLLQLRHNDPLFFSPQMDALYHHQWALAIVAGREFIADAFFRAPLYPYFLGLVYKLFGANQMAARIIQALIGSATCGLVYILARQLLKPQGPSPKPQASSHKLPKSEPHSSLLTLHSSDLVPRIAGLMMAAYPLAIWYDGELLLEGLLTFLLMLGFVLLYRSRDKDRQWWLPGIVFGLAAITRPNVLAFLAVLPIWLFVEGKGSKGPRVQGSKSETRTLEPSNPGTRSIWTRLLPVWGAAALVILPVTIRNYVVSRQFVPIAWQAGTNFYIGNSPESDGMTAVLPGTRGGWWGGYDDAKRLAEQALGRPLKGAEIDRYWLGKGLEFWREQPGKALGLLARKTFLWLVGYEVSNERDLYAAKRYSYIDYLFFNSRFLKFPFGILLPLALAGVWFRRREWRRLLPLYLFVVAYSLSFVVFFVTSRYRTSIVPIAAILAAIGLIGLVGPVSRRERIVGLGIALVAFVLFNANLAGAGRQVDQSRNYVAAAVGLHAQGRDSEALTEVRQALKFDSARAVLSLEAALLSDLGNSAAAESSARAAIRLYPSDVDAYEALGGVLATAGRLDSAAAYFELVRSRAPYSVDAWCDLGNIAFSRRDYVKARYYYEGALKVRPTFTRALFGLGLCEYYEGDRAAARAHWQEVLKLDPSFVKAGQALEHLK